jgi:hypothetical protein
MRGGRRARLLLDNTRIVIIGGLMAKGWFDADRRHRPLHYIIRPQDWQQPIEPNSIAICAEDSWDDPQGLGGDVVDTRELYVDVYAESDPLGWHLAVDIRDILLGKLTETGRDGPVIDVYDLAQATPVPVTQVDVEDVTVDRTESVAREWQAHWFMVRIHLTDEYADEFDATEITSTWIPQYADAWNLIRNIEHGP